MSTKSATLERFAALIPTTLTAESGKVFYSGRSAFSRESPLYVLGVNPGGDPENHLTETIGDHTHQVLKELPDDWSAYRDEVWEGAPPGTYPMAARVLHLFRQVELQPGLVPASNLYFVRSRREEHTKNRQADLTELCWPFHALVVETLRPRVILCLGGTAGNYVRKKFRATRLVAQFTEKNNRRWKSQTFVGDAGIRIVVASHPSIADWSASATDPSGLVQEALK